jgi:hypothetical protein
MHTILPDLQSFSQWDSTILNRMHTILPKNFNYHHKVYLDLQSTALYLC